MINYRNVPEMFMSQRSLQVAFLLLIAGLVFNHPAFVFATLIASSYVFAQRIPRSFFTTTISSTILGAALITTFAGLLTIVFWLFRFSVELHLIMYLAVFVALLFSLLSRRVSRPVHFFDFRDSIAFITLLLYFLLTIYGIYRQTPQLNNAGVAASIIQSVTYGIDDISHLMMYQSTIEADRGLLLGSKDAGAMAKPSSAGYPKMSHTIAGLIYSQGQPNKVSILFMYASVKFLLFAVAIYVIARSSLEFITGKGSKLLIHAVSIPALMFVTLFLTHIFIEEGFFSIWPLLIYIPLIILFMNHDVSKIRASNLYIVAGMTAIVTMSWPIMGLPLYAALLMSMLKSVRPWRWSTLWAMVISLLGFTQLYVQFFDKGATISQSEINASGGIPMLPLLLIILSAVTTLFVLLLHKRHEILSTTFLFSYVASLIGITTLIAYLNVYATSNVQYFYMKSALLMVIIFSVLLIPVYIDMFVKFIINRYSKSFIGIVMGAIISTLIVASIPLAFGAQHIATYSGKYLVSGDRHITKETASELLLSDMQLKDTVLIGADNRLENYYSNALIGGINRFNKCQISAQTLGISSALDTARSVKVGCQGVNSIHIIVIDSEDVINQVSCADISQLIEAFPAKSRDVKVIGNGECTKLLN